MDDNRFRLVNVSGMWNRNVSPIPELLVSSYVPEEMWRDTYHDVVEHHSKISHLLACERNIRFCSVGFGIGLGIVLTWLTLVLKLTEMQLYSYLILCCWSLPVVVAVLLQRWGMRWTKADQSNHVQLMLEWEQYVEEQQYRYRSYGIRLILLQTKRARGTESPAIVVGALEFARSALNQPSCGTVNQGARVTRATSSSSCLVEELQQLRDLKVDGDLTPEEFVWAKVHLLKPSHGLHPALSSARTSAQRMGPIDSLLSSGSTVDPELAVAHAIPMRYRDETHKTSSRSNIPLTTNPSCWVPAPVEVEQGSIELSARQQLQQDAARAILWSHQI